MAKQSSISARKARHSNGEKVARMQRILTRDHNYYRDLFHLAIPVALQNLITFLVSLADNLMVSKLGDFAVSGVYTGSQIQTLLQLLTNGIGVAVTILGAQYWGKREAGSIRRITGIGMQFSVAVGALLTVICGLFPEAVIRIFVDDPMVIAEGTAYLRILSLSFVFFCATQVLVASMRCVETTHVGMIASASSLVVNICLNYVLIFGKLGFPAMGVRGAAIATVIARVVETLIALLYVLRYDHKLCFRLPELFRGDRALRRDFIRYGVPVVLGDVVWSVNLMANTKILGVYGASVLTAANNANNMNTLAYVAINGLASAVGIITGKTIGAGKTELMKEYARTTQAIFLALGLVVGGLVFACSGPFVAMYQGISAEAAAESLRFVRVLSVTLIGTCYQMPCLFGLVKSGGDISFVFKNDTIFVFLVVLPSAIIASKLGAAPWVVFACLKCDQILKCLVAVIKVNRYNWMKNLTRAQA